MLLLLGIFEQKFFCQPRLVPQTEEVVGINLMALGFQSLLQQSRERQVHIVATQQNVIADCYPLERQIAALFRDRNQAEIRRASTNVAYQNQIADLDSLAPTIALGLEPSVKRSLRFLQKGHVLQTCFFWGAQGQFTSLFIERSGHGKQHVLLAQGLLGMAAIPDSAQISQVLR